MFRLGTGDISRENTTLDIHKLSQQKQQSWSQQELFGITQLEFGVIHCCCGKIIRVLWAQWEGWDLTAKPHPFHRTDTSLRLLHTTVFGPGQHRDNYNSKHGLWPCTVN